MAMIFQIRLFQCDQYFGRTIFMLIGAYRYSGKLLAQPFTTVYLILG